MDFRPAIVVSDLRVSRGGALVLPGLSLTVAAGLDHRPARAERLRQDHADARVVGVQLDRRRHGHRARAARRFAERCAPRGLCDPGAVGLRRSDGAREPALLRARAGRARPADRRGGRPSASSRPGRCTVAALSGGQRARVSLATRAARAAPSCWCSTSRPSASTRCCGPSCGDAFRRLADAGAPLLVSSHVMDEAERCDDLILLMRDGGCSRPSPARR